MTAIIVDRDSIEKQTAQNMIEAGEITPGDYPCFILLLKNLTDNELNLALSRSWQKREDALTPVKFYQVSLENISPN